jgi:hypothetical protein
MVRLRLGLWDRLRLRVMLWVDDRLSQVLPGRVPDPPGRLDLLGALELRDRLVGVGAVVAVDGQVVEAVGAEELLRLLHPRALPGPSGAVLESRGVQVDRLGQVG